MGIVSAEDDIEEAVRRELVEGKLTPEQARVIREALANGHTRRCERMSHVFLDLPSGHVSLDGEEVARLREAADAAAGRSSIARDLSAILDSAIRSSRPRALQRAEVRALIGLARDAGLADVEAKLTANRRTPGGS
jgi:hypothetical protein